MNIVNPFIALLMVYSLSGCSVCMVQNEKGVKNSLLRQYQVGEGRDVIEAKIQDRYPEDYKYLDRIAWLDQSNSVGPIVVCEYLTSIATSKGYTAKWMFDEHGNLSDIDVRVFADGP